MATKKGGGARTTRSETVTVRLEPKLRYLAEVAARTQRRTLSSFIEWAIEDALRQAWLNPSASVATQAEKLWDVDEPDRFVKLALAAPELLNYDEQRLWKLIKENGAVWKGSYEHQHHVGEWHWYLIESDVNYEKLREHWDVFVAVAAGDAPVDMLPQWDKVDPIPF